MADRKEVTVHQLLINLLLIATFRIVVRDFILNGVRMIKLFVRLINFMQTRQKEFLLEWDGLPLTISSNFDSGNLSQAQIVDQKLILTPALDPMHPQYSTRPSSKTFFHFCLTVGSPVCLPLAITRMKILEYFTSEEQFEDYYRVCVRKRIQGRNQLSDYEKIKPNGMKRVEGSDGLELHFSIDLYPNEETFLAFHYPYPYEKTQIYLRMLKESLASHHRIYFVNEPLIESLEGRAVNLVTLTDSSMTSEQTESRISKSIFPCFEIEGRPRKFNKPYLLFTCRVHPGETSSSYALEGLINFLISEDERAKLLLSSFVFLIVPLVNPDGAFHGTFRMDTQGHNLNRFYGNAQSHRQPAVFAIQIVATYYASRLIFCMDLHGHPHPAKGSFIYGNCLPQIEEQTQTQLYARLLSQDSQCFGYNWCNFSNSQMNSRDINELLTKDGSARVQLYRLLSIPFAYTMEMGCHGAAVKSISSEQYRRQDKIFTMRDYREHGKSIILSFFRLLLMSCNGIKSQTGRNLQVVRQDLCKELLEKEERFRLADTLVFKKVKIINDLIIEQYYQPLFKKHPQLENLLNKYTTALERAKAVVHARSQEVPPLRKSLPRKQFSLNMKEVSRTIDGSSRQKGIRSFRSTIEPRPETVRFQNPNKQDNNTKYAKMLNLNFNPFPAAEKKKTYNVIGSRRSQLKKQLINQLDFNRQESPSPRSMELFDIDAVDIHSQLEIAERNFKPEPVRQQLRLHVFNNFSPRNQEEGNEYLDSNWEGLEQLVLPKIIRKERQTPQFEVEVQIQQEYDRKYNLRDHTRDFYTLHQKATLRNNGLRMRSLIKSMK